MRLLVFSAMWCSSCLVMKPIITDVVTALWLACEWIDYDEQEELCTLWWITQSLPTLVLLDETWWEVTRISGEYSRDDLRRWIDDATHRA